MKVTDEQLQKLGELSRLYIDKSEVENIKKSLSEVIDYMEKLKELDLKDVEPMMRVDESVSPFFREDKVKESLHKSLVFKNAPDVQQDHFAIPKSF